MVTGTSRSNSGKLVADNIKKSYSSDDHHIELPYDDDKIMLEFFKYKLNEECTDIERIPDSFLNIEFGKDLKKLSDGRYLIPYNYKNDIPVTVSVVDENDNPVKLKDGILEIDPTKGAVGQRFFKLDGKTHTFTTTWSSNSSDTTYGKIYTRIPEHPLVERVNIIFELLGENDNILT